MKIVSKYKDFYDYLEQDYDSSIVYVRAAKLVKSPGLDELFLKRPGLWSKETSKLQSYDLSGYHLKPGDIGLCNYIFGVYPYVYSTPVIAVRAMCGNSESWYASYPGRSFIEKLKDDKDDKELRKYAREILLQSEPGVIIPADFENRISRWDSKTTYSEIIDSAGKIECQEIFRRLEVPVFLILSDPLRSELDMSGKFKSLGIKLEPQNNYLLNLSFNYIDPRVIKYWYQDLCDPKTYNDIENFLWSIKQEPTSEMTDSQKIVSHGFDLKTSFRKM